MPMRYRTKSLERATQALVLLLLAGYVVLMLWNPHLGPIDDHELLATVQQHHWLHPFIEPQNGRFFPLDGQELNLVSRFSTTPRAYYVVNAIELLIFAFLFYGVCLRLGGRFTALVMLLVLLVLPGFATAWLRLLVPERDELLFLTLYVWCYIRAMDKPGAAALLGAVVAANLALFTKEPAFLMLGTFSAVRLWSTSRSPRRPVFALDVVTLLSCGVYIAVYYLLVFRHHTRLYSGGMPPLSFFAAVAKLTGSFALNDPLIIFLGVPLFVWRVASVLARRDSLEPLGDPLLAGGMIYAAVFVPLDLYAPHYWLPCYAFILPAFLVHSRRSPQAWRRPAVLFGGIAVFALLTAAAPSAITIAAQSRYIPRNFSALLTMLRQRITAGGHRRPTAIYLYGITVHDIEIVGGLEEYLVHAGVPPDNFAIYASGPSGRPERFVTERTFVDASTTGPAIGDIVVRTPFSHDDAEPGYIDLRSGGYSMLWRSRSPFAPGDLGLRPLLKRIYLQAPSRRHPTATAHSEDTDSDCDYYVYERNY